MINFYNELRLDPKASTQQIRQELLKKERVWMNRELSNPEAAQEKLVLIRKAKKAFASDAARSDYDMQLANAQKRQTSTESNARRVDWRKYQNDALDYLADKQIDLAKTAITRAVSSMGTEEDADCYNIAAYIYMEASELNTALDYINKAIVINGNEPKYLLTRALILHSQYEATGRNDMIPRLRNAYITVIKKSNRSKNQEEMGIALGNLALSYFDHQPQDVAKAETYAKQAMAIGDPWGNGKDVFDKIQEAHNIRNRRDEFNKTVDNIQQESQPIIKKSINTKKELDRKYLYTGVTTVVGLIVCSTISILFADGKLVFLSRLVLMILLIFELLSRSLRCYLRSYSSSIYWSGKRLVYCLVTPLGVMSWLYMILLVGVLSSSGIISFGITIPYIILRIVGKVYALRIGKQNGDKKNISTLMIKVQEVYFND